MSQASGGPGMPQMNWNNTSDLLRAIFVKMFVKDTKISN